MAYNTMPSFVYDVIHIAFLHAYYVHVCMHPCAHVYVHMHVETKT